MTGFILRRLGVALLVLLAVSVITFALTNTTVDPARAIAGEGAMASDVEAIRESYGLDRPIVERYFSWLASCLQGDLGTSYRQRRPVLDVVTESLPVTLLLGSLAFLFALVVSLPLAVAAAMKPNTFVDRLALSIALIGQAMPPFWFALLGILVFSINLRLLPATGSSTAMHFVLPAVTLGYYATPTIMRLTRAGMLDVLGSDFVRTARAKGLSTWSVVVKHALRNAVLPVVSVAAVQLGFMLGGSVVVETIFSMHGIGYLAAESIRQSDLPVVQAIVLIVAVLYVVLTLGADVLNAWLDPRIRMGSQA